MGYETILFETRGGIATVTLNRPQQLNAINRKMADEFLEAIMKCEHEPSVKVVVLTGAGKVFCAGGDIKEMKSLIDRGNPDSFFRELMTVWHNVILQLRRVDKLVIASVNGAAAGAGFNLVLACDWRIAAENARFSEAFVRIGLSVDSGGTYFLPRYVGFSKALELLVTGDTVDAKTAVAMGLLNEVVPENELSKRTESVASKLANGPSLAIGRIKHLLNLGLQNNLADQLHAEAQFITTSARTEDFHEGLRAFFEKRQPSFKGS